MFRWNQPQDKDFSYFFKGSTVINLHGISVTTMTLIVEINPVSLHIEQDFRSCRSGNTKQASRNVHKK